MNSLSPRELDSTLAALRAWSRTPNDIAPDPLTEPEIDALCERLNVEAPACPLCGNTDGCRAKYEWYRCTRVKGHTGPHVACGTTDHAIHTWPQ